VGPRTGGGKAGHPPAALAPGRQRREGASLAARGADRDENATSNRKSNLPICGAGFGSPVPWPSADGGTPPKDVKNADRTDYVYENKGTDDKMTDAEDDIFTQIARILQKSTAFFRY